MVLDVGAGARSLVAGGGTGRVAAVYRRAAYVRLDDGWLAVTTASAPPGPLHLRTRMLPTLTVGERVDADGCCLRGRHWVVRADGPAWDGVLPDPDRFAQGVRVSGVPLQTFSVRNGTRSVGVDDGTAATVREAERAGDLEAVAATIGGRGPGLTPAGDDLLAGLLMIDRVRGGVAAEPRLRAVVDAVTTTPVARAFLLWAARGQCVAPVHDWLGAVARADAPAAGRALEQLRSIGATSGDHLVAGLLLGARRLGA